MGEVMRSNIGGRRFIAKKPGNWNYRRLEAHLRVVVGAKLVRWLSLELYPPTVSPHDVLVKSCVGSYRKRGGDSFREICIKRLKVLLVLLVSFHHHMVVVGEKATEEALRGSAKQQLSI